jgi:hypothetical protein
MWLSFSDPQFLRRYKHNAALILDSAAAFFGRDNVGLCGVSHFFKVGPTLSHHACTLMVMRMHELNAISFLKVCTLPSSFVLICMVHEFC